MSTLYTSLQEHEREVERIRAEKGDQAAEEHSASFVGAGLGGAGGMLTGAAVGTAFAPGVGTVIGAGAGYLAGAATNNDRTYADNARSAVKAAGKLLGFIHR